MIDAKETEELIGLASALRADLDELAKTFRKLLELMEVEHEAIKVANLNQLEVVTAEKETFGATIEASSEAILRNSEKIRVFHDAAIGRNKKDGDATAKNVGEWLRRLCSMLDDKQLATQVLKRVTDSVIGAFDSLRDLKTKSQQKVDMNTYLARKLLEHHRENIRLWQEVISEFDATYNPKGESRAPQAKSVLQVKA